MLAVSLFAAAFACTSDLDCSLNGVCTGGKCECDAAWNGTACEELAILPREPGHVPAYGYAPNVSSWGAGVLKGDDGLYHMFVAEMADDYGNFCGLSVWGSHCRIAHATGATPDGVFTKQDTALPQMSCNPAPVRPTIGKLAGKWLLFHIGGATGAPVANCTDGAARRAPEAAGPFAHVADSPAGPWSPLPSLKCNNPAPFVHANGTFYVMCNGGGFSLHRTEDPTAGDWREVVTLTFPASWGGSGSVYLHNEDPYLYVDGRGNWHVLVHRYDYRDGVPGQGRPVLVSGHAFSADGLNWHFSDVQPYNNWVDRTDGTRQYFATVERPRMVFDAAGRPTHLINAVSPVWGEEPCSPCPARPGSQHSCVDCKITPGVDWTYTIVSELRV